jgi:hypothetical protein
MNILKHKLIILLVLLATQLHAQTLHMFIVGDDEDKRIGSSIDLNRLNRYASDIASKASLSLKLYEFRKSRHTDAQVQRALENLRCNSQDAVWFYYSGHGYNNNESDFTSFTLSRDTEISMEYVSNQINVQKPRFSLVMFDACNFRSARSTSSGSAFAAARTMPSTEKCKQLFRNAKGKIIFASNTAGENKYSYGNNQEGGFFTRSFLEALSVANNSWAAVIEYTKNQTISLANSIRVEQIPVARIALEQRQTAISSGGGCGSSDNNPSPQATFRPRNKAVVRNDDARFN